MRITSEAQVLTLAPESVEAVAQRVVELMRAPLPRAGLVDAQALADELGTSREWVYRNAERLGAIRLGSGARGRLRFDVEAAKAAMARLASKRSHDESANDDGGFSAAHEAAPAPFAQWFARSGLCARDQTAGGALMPLSRDPRARSRQVANLRRGGETRPAGNRHAMNAGPVGLRRPTRSSLTWSGGSTPCCP